MDLVIFVGLQASGKSGFFRARFAETHVHVSKDAMPNARNKERRQRTLIGEALAAGRSVVVDNTNPTADGRAPLIELGRDHGARLVGYFFVSTLGDALARNRARKGRARVPDVALFATIKKLQPPTYAEGFDELYEVELGPGGGFAIRPLDRPATLRPSRPPGSPAANHRFGSCSGHQAGGGA